MGVREWIEQILQRKLVKLIVASKNDPGWASPSTQAQRIASDLAPDIEVAFEAVAVDAYTDALKGVPLKYGSSGQLVGNHVLAGVEALGGNDGE